MKLFTPAISEKGKRKQLFAAYTFLFIVIALVVYMAFYLGGRSFIWSTGGNTDGIDQHVNAFTYYGRYLRHLFYTIFVDHSLNLKTFDLSIGYGQDIISTIHYYAVGDIFALVSGLVPTRYAEIAFNALVPVRLYCAGIAFIVYNLYHNRSKKGILLGTMVYCFSGFSIYCIKHPYFLNTLVYFPLYCLGVDRILDRKSPWFFCVVVALSLLSNFYFFYMLVIFTILYAIVSILGHENLTVKYVFYSVAKCVWYALIGVGISCIIFLPVVYLFFSSARAAEKSFVPLVYTWNYYRDLFLSFGSSYLAPDWVRLSFSAIAIIVINVIVVSGKKYIREKVTLILMLLFLLFPFFGSFFNGLSYVANRWTFVCALAIGTMLAKIYPDLENLLEDKKRAIGVFVLSSCYVLFSFMFVFFTKDANNLWAIIITIVCMCSLLIVLYVKSIKKNMFPLMTLIVAVNVALNGAFFYNKNFGGYSKEYLKYGHVKKDLILNENFKLLPHNQNYRFDYVNFTKKYNRTMNTNQSSIMTYLSLLPGDSYLFLESLGYTNNVTHRINFLEGRSAVANLFGVKYLIGKKNSVTTPPYGYEYSDKLSSKKYDVYVNKYALPLGFTYSSVIKKSDYEKINVLTRSQALLQSALVDDKDAKIKSEHIDLPEQELPVRIEILTPDTLTYYDGTYISTGKSKIKLIFDAPEDNDIYFTVEDFSMKSFTKEDEGLPKVLGIEDKKISYHKKRIKSSTLRLHGSNKANRYISYRTKYNSRYIKRKFYTVGMSSFKTGKQSITLTLDKKGIYKLDQMKVYNVPHVHTKERLEALGKETLQNISIDNNIIKGDITVSDKKLLNMTVPYSSGWSIYVDGKKVPSYKTNGMFIGTYLEKGHHNIELRYTTPGFKLGAVISIVSVVLLGISLFIRRKFRHHITAKLLS